MTKPNDRKALRAGIRTAKRLGIRTAADMAERERATAHDADTALAILLAEDIRREIRAAKTLPAPAITE